MRVLLFLLLTLAARAEPVRIQVFIALADNRTQGISPVPERIGNGDDAEANLYWGCSEALKPVLRASAQPLLTRETRRSASKPPRGFSPPESRRKAANPRTPRGNISATKLLPPTANDVSIPPPDSQESGMHP